MDKQIKKLKKEYDDLYSVIGDNRSTHKIRLDKLVEMIIALSKQIESFSKLK